MSWSPAAEKNGDSQPERLRYKRMSAGEKMEVINQVAPSLLPKRQELSQLGVPRSTYYRRLKRASEQGLEDQVGGGRPPWNRLTPKEVESVLEAAREMPELSSRQLAAWMTDYGGFSVSESTVYRILLREGLVKRSEVKLVAGKECHRKTSAPHQMWANDATYFRVSGWGFYYMVNRHGRLLPLHPGSQGSVRHDFPLPHRGGAGRS